jgi:hypothetical protein
MDFEKYGKIVQLGDPLVKDIFDGEYVIEEKLDGSNFRFGIGKDGKRYFGSKEVNYTDERPPDKMFARAVEEANKILDKFALDRGDGDTIFICEYLQSPKQNTLSYGRVPKNHLMLLDVYVDGELLHPISKEDMAEKLDMECIPMLDKRITPITMEELERFLETESVLGKEKIEGIVIKNYNKRFIAYGKGHVYMAKYVKDEFKERNAKEWNQGVPLSEQVLQKFPKEPRWEKAVQHLKERGESEGNMRDMARLAPEIETDLEAECKEEIKEFLWGRFRHEIVRGYRHGLAEWYKKKLAESVL